ncbi:hypothetical protein OAQ84_00730 [Bdellovibrionales bacterium]|nr:hypothetical protein [Bdellovibrionales bacterium]
MIKPLIYLLLFSFIAPTSYAENWVIDKIRRLDIKTNIPLVDLDQIDGLDLSLRGRYEVEPSYLGNYYSRLDRLRLKFDINPTDLLDLNERIGLSMARNSQITVVRQFPSQKEALIAPPTSLLLKRLPISAERAIERLKVGDLVSFQTELSFSVGPNWVTENGWASTSLYAAYVVRGEFEVRVYRLNNKRIRMQIFSTQQRYKTVGGKIKILDGVDVFGVTLSDNKIDKLIKLDLLDFNVSWGNHKLFLMDYVLKLDDPRIASAYDDIMSASTNLKYLIDLSIVNPNKKNRALLKHISSNFVQIEKVIQEEIENGVKQKDRVARRIFKGENDDNFNGGQFKIGLSFLRYGEKSIFRDIHLSQDLEDGSTNYYGFPSYTIDTDFRLLFGLLAKNKSILNYNMIFKENEKQELVEFLNVGGYFSYSDKIFDPYLQNLIRKSIREHLSESIYESIDWGEWNKKIVRKNARVYLEYYFHKSAFQYLRKYSQLDIETSIREFLNNLPTTINASETQRNISGTFCATDYLRERLRGIARRDRYTGDICHIAYHLFNAVQNHEEPKWAKQAFMALKRNELFRKIGIGFISSLIPPEDLKNVFRFEMNWFAKDTKTISFKYGSDQERDLYKIIFNIQSLIDNRSYDLRIFDDALKGKE